MFNTLTSSGNWKTDIENLRKFKREVDEISDDMPTARPYFERKYRQSQEQLAGRIVAGVVAEQREAIANYKRALKKMDDAREREIVRWDVPRLQAERTAIRSMVDEINRTNSPFEDRDKLERLQVLYSEMTAESQPLERRRAAVEVFANITEYGIQGQTRGGEEVRFRVGELAQVAKQAEPALRVTDEMLQADDQIQAAKVVLIEAHEQIADVGYTIGVGGFTQKPSMYHPGDTIEVGAMAFGPLGDAWNQVKYRVIGLNTDVLEIMPEKEMTK